LVDSYKTIEKQAEGVFKEKGSKFLSFAFPVNSEEEIREIIQNLKKEHHSARHHCYAWRMGVEKKTFRANDDGEPSSTGGKPILGQIQSYDLTNILIVVVRYFGGTLLGVSGLINAYRSAAQDAINQSKIIDLIVEATIKVEFDYEITNEVMKIIKEEKLVQKSSLFGQSCCIQVLVRVSEYERIAQELKKIKGVAVSIITT
jgi:uncharacterized YigZ family protein